MLPTEEADCPLCTSMHKRPLFAGRSIPWPEGFAVVECVACGFRFTSPRPTRESIRQFYRPGYGPYQGFADAPSLFDSRRSVLAGVKNGLKYLVLTRHFGYPIHSGRPPALTHLRLPAALEHLAFTIYSRRNPRVPIRSGAGRALDIGCGNGAHLLLLKQLGWEVTGFDLSDQTDRSVQAAGIEIFTGRLKDLPARCSGYDAISMWHVLEHLHDPAAGLLLARGRLAPGGRLYVEVPNSGSAAARVLGPHWHQWDLPRHLSHFTAESLARAFRQSGLRLCRLTPIRKTAVPQALRAWAVAPGGPSRLKQLLRRRGCEPLARIAGFPLSILGRGENILAEATI